MRILHRTFRPLKPSKTPPKFHLRYDRFCLKDLSLRYAFELTVRHFAGVKLENLKRSWIILIHSTSFHPKFTHQLIPSYSIFQTSSERKKKASSPRQPWPTVLAAGPISAVPKHPKMPRSLVHGVRRCDSWTLPTTIAAFATLLLETVAIDSWNSGSSLNGFWGYQKFWIKTQWY